MKGRSCLNMLHLILAAIAILLFLIFSILLIPVEWVVGKISTHARDVSRLRILQGFTRILLFLCGVKVTKIGYEKIPRDRSVMYAINHRSVFDILVTLAYCPTLTGYIAKKEFEKVPLLSWWIRWTNGFFLDRENLKEGLKTILAAIDQIKNGISIAIFPEGTRNRNPDERELLEFHEGSFKIATKPGCPIVPVAVCHASEVFEDHLPFIHGKRIIVEYGDPIDPASLTGDAKKFVGRHVREIIREMIVKNHDL